LVAEDYHTRSELIGEFLSLENQHPTRMSHEIIGQTVEGRNLYLFKIGNPHGGRVLYSATHGNELCGPEIYLLYAKWLLENQEPGVSDRILKRNYTLIVPHIDLDRYKSTRTNQGSRKNANGVDLNRNFPASWRTDCMWLTDPATGEPITCSSNADCPEGYQCIYGYCYKKGCACNWSDVPTKWNYRGKNPDAQAAYARGPSEPETQAMLQIHKKWRPSFFLDYHTWAVGSPFFAKPSYRGRKKAEANGWGTFEEITARHDDVAQKIRDLATQRGALAYPYKTLGICGAHADDGCATGGAVSYLIEGHNYRDDGYGGSGRMVQCPYEDVVNIWFPNFLPFAITFSRECESPGRIWVPALVGVLTVAGLIYYVRR